MSVSGGTVSNITIDGGTLNISGGTVSGITNTSGSLYVSGGTLALFSGTSAGQNLTISKLTGNTTFVINTNVAQNVSDKITIQDSTSSGSNTIIVNYDPSFLTGQTGTGSATFATTQSSSVTFTTAATEYGAYRFMPSISSTDGLNWNITGFTVNSTSNPGTSDPGTSSPGTSSPGTSSPGTSSPGTNGNSLAASETVYSGLDMTSGTMVLWRAENNNLTRRLGELRSSQGQAGEWVRVYRGEQKAESLNNRQVTQQYTAIQGGYDTKHESKDGTWFTGYTIGYFHGNSTLERGEGTGSSVTVGAYASWLGDKGHYLDIIAKQGRLRNSFDSYLNDASATKVSGHYSNWGTSLSAEYGHRQKLQNGWYLEPQAEINLTRITSASYTMSDNTSVHNDSVTSMLGRIGLAIGRDQKKNSYYFKTSLAREFSAHPNVTMASGGLSPVTLEQNLKDTWLEFDIGWTAAYDHNVNSYVELSKTTGGKINTPWQINVGIRKSF